MLLVASGCVRSGARLCEPVTVTLAAGTDAWVGRALAAYLQIFSQQNSRGPASPPKGAKFILEEEESCVSALLQLSCELKAPCCPSASAAMPCTCAAAGTALWCSPKFQRPSHGRSCLHSLCRFRERLLCRSQSQVLLQSAGMCSWSITAAPAARLGWAKGWH